MAKELEGPSFAFTVSFLNLTLPSLQCLFLSRSESTFFSPKKYQALREDFQEQECADADEALVEDMAWIGTTNHLVDETFSLLRHTGPRLTTISRFCNKSKKLLVKLDLSEAAIAHVREITAWDRAIYHNVQRSFSINSMFTNYAPPIAMSGESAATE